MGWGPRYSALSCLYTTSENAALVRWYMYNVDINVTVIVHIHVHEIHSTLAELVVYKVREENTDSKYVRI